MLQLVLQINFRHYICKTKTMLVDKNSIISFFNLFPDTVYCDFILQTFSCMKPLCGFHLGSQVSSPSKNVPT